MIRCLMVEDEILPAELLSDYIAQTPLLTLSAHCTDALAAMEWLQHHPVEVMFLDIHLPQMRGLDMLALLENPPLVVITSAYHAYALPAYRFEVVDYLLKPYDFARFLEAVQKVRKRLALVPGATGPESLFVKAGKQQVRLQVQDICYLESVQEYCRIHLRDRMVQTEATLSGMLERLPEGQFMRIHRSYIVRKEAITAFSVTEITVGTTVLPIGRTYQDEVAVVLEAWSGNG